MTAEELQEEWDYRYHERIGIMCGTAEPTPEQEQLARQEADATIQQLRAQPDELIL